MKLINTTRTHQELVQNQLDNTDAFLVEMLSLHKHLSIMNS